MNRAEIVVDLKNMIGPAVEVDDAGLSTWVNDAYSQMVDEIVKVLPDFFTKSATTATVNGQQEYTLPADYEKAIMVNQQIAGEWRRCVPMGNADIRFIPRHASTNSSQGFSQAEPQYYITSGNVIGIMPIPTETTAAALKVWYLYQPAQMTLDASVPAFPAKYHHYIKYGAYANYLDQDDEHVAAERMRRRFDRLVERMVENLESPQVDEIKSVEISQNRDLYIEGTTNI